MFFVVNPVEITGNYFAKKRKISQINRMPPYRVSTRSGIPFYVLDVAVLHGETDWSRVSDYAVRQKNFLFPENLRPPENAGISAFIPTRLPPVITANTALSVIKKSGLSPLGLSIVLADKNASLTRFADTLFTLASTITVVTKKPHKYNGVAQRAMEKFGASPIITDRPFFPENSVVIAADPDDGFTAHKCAVFSQNPMFGNSLCFCGGRLPHDSRYENYLSLGIDPMTFYSAVFELCASSEHFSMCHETLFSGHGEFSVEECAKILYDTINSVKS